MNPFGSAPVWGWALVLSLGGAIGAQETEGEGALPTESEATATPGASESAGSSEDDCVLCFDVKYFDLSETLLKEDLDFVLDFGGWAQVGYTSRSTGLFNTNPDRLNWHQLWFYVEKTADGSEKLDWGFRFDSMYGTDSGEAQSFGNNPGNWDYLNGWDRGGSYGFAFPQLYGELAYKDFSVKGGHFFTLLGYETVTAPDNFFFSHSLTMYNSEAFTHTGVLGTYRMRENVEVYAGWTLGWDTGFDQFDNGSNFLGGVRWGILDNLVVSYITTVGDLGWVGSGYVHSIVVDWSITDRLNYVAQSDYDNFNGDPDAGKAATETIGLNQYLLYAVNKCIGVGGRFEWWAADGDNYLVFTAGVNYNPIPNVVFRPEIRYQGSPDDPADPIVPIDEVIFGIDAILTF